MSDETKWSPEPWSVTRRRDGIAIRDAGIFLPFDCEETARRIVACVNACAGLPTAALEAGRLAEALKRLMEAQSFAAAVASDSLKDPGTWSLHAGMGEVIRDRCYTVLRALGRIQP